ncbi:MAG TPA: hypothetical protein VM598_00575 [Bdellovibrionota bacterium]|nr:hypothetical protein [Bdellovibrionota bacterium]
MSSDRLGRNPFDRSTYSKSKAKPKAKSKSKPKAKTARARLKPGSAPRGSQVIWKLVLEEILKKSPPALRQLGVCAKLRQAFVAWRDLRASVST